MGKTYKDNPNKWQRPPVKRKNPHNPNRPPKGRTYEYEEETAAREIELGRRSL